MPVFEGLLPTEHDSIVTDLLFELATWHAFAKIQIHTDKTLDHLTAATKTLTGAMQRFLCITCKAFTTVELPKESEAHG